MNYKFIVSIHDIHDIEVLAPDDKTAKKIAELIHIEKDIQTNPITQVKKVKEVDE
jgi:hypothetical protein